MERQFSGDGLDHRVTKRRDAGKRLARRHAHPQFAAQNLNIAFQSREGLFITGGILQSGDGLSPGALHAGDLRLGQPALAAEFGQLKGDLERALGRLEPLAEFRILKLFSKSLNSRTDVICSTPGPSTPQTYDSSCALTSTSR